MTKTEINRETLRAALAEAVEERTGDFMYPDAWKQNGEEWGRCLYFVDGVGPACIFGVALEKMGYPAETLPYTQGIREILPALGVTDVDLILAANSAQETQDGGFPWSMALADFDKSLAEA